MRGHDDPDRAIDARQLLDRGHVLHIAHAGPAILRRKDHSQHAELAQFLDGAHRELTRLVPSHDVGQNFAFRKLAHALFKLQLFLVELEIQNASGEWRNAAARARTARYKRHNLNVRLEHDVRSEKSYLKSERSESRKVA